MANKINCRNYLQQQQTLSTVLLPMTGNNPLLLWPILCKSSQDLGIRPMLVGALAEKNESKLSLLKHQNNLRIVLLLSNLLIKVATVAIKLSSFPFILSMTVRASAKSACVAGNGSIAKFYLMSLMFLKYFFCFET